MFLSLLWIYFINLSQNDASFQNWASWLTLDNAIHWINQYPADSAVWFVNTYPLESDLSGEFLDILDVFRQMYDKVAQLYSKKHLQHDDTPFFPLAFRKFLLVHAQAFRFFFILFWHKVGFSSWITWENNVKQHVGEIFMPACSLLLARTYNSRLRKPKFNTRGSGEFFHAWHVNQF